MPDSKSKAGGNYFLAGAGAGAVFGAGAAFGAGLAAAVGALGAAAA